MKIVPSHYVPAIPARFAPAPPPTKRAVFPPSPVWGGGPGRPVLLYDSVTLQAGAEQPLKNRAFQNTFNGFVELHSAIFAAEQLNANVSTARATSIATTAVQIGVRRAASNKVLRITDGFIPMWMLAPSDNRLAAAAGANGLTALIDWKFASPIVLGPKDQIEVSVRHLSYFTNNTLAHVAFGGEVVPRSTAARRLPYATVWSGHNFAYAEDGSDTSGPAALSNDLENRKLHVERIIGRFVTAALQGANTIVNDLVDGSNQMDRATLRMHLQQTPIIRSFAKWITVFGANAALECDFDMLVNDFITVTVAHPPGPTLATPFTSFTGQPFVSIVGSREE
jgi:hypothetical protein